MSCSLTEEEIAALEAEAAERRAVASGTCAHAAPCGKKNCSRGGNGGASGSCTNGDQDTRAQGSWACAGAQAKGSTCMKCKTAPAVVLVRQREPLCQTCLEAGISGKVRALKSHKLLQPRDHVAIAFSGGSSSQALLCNVLPMRKHAATPRKERGKIELDITVIHVNEASAYGLGDAAAEAHSAAVLAAAQRCGAVPPAASVLVVPLSDVFLLPSLCTTTPAPGADAGAAPAGSSNMCCGGNGLGSGRGCNGVSEQQEAAGQLQQPEPQEGGAAAGERGAAGVLGATASQRPGGQPEGAGGEGAAGREAREGQLRALLQSVPDPTGREDLVRLLRTRLLAATAARLGACKLLRGDSATALAARVVADTAKGRGYSLPGDIQLVDCRGAGRGEPHSLYPMREVTLKEAVYMCRLRGLRPVELPQPPAAPRASINMLAAAFVDSLQTSLPSTVFTVLRTASALQPFPFNTLPEAPQPAATAAQAPAAPPAAAVPLATEAEAAGTAAACLPYGDERRAAGTAGAAAAAVEGVAARRCGIACCALCRAPLTRREQEAIAAARAGREKAAGAANGSAAAGVSDGADEDADEGDMEDAAAPFCQSCRGQILFTPGHPSSILVGGGGGPGGGAEESAVLALLPRCMLGSGVLAQT